jgi:asparagine synthase (glutamine-hydrolysing)
VYRYLALIWNPANPAAAAAAKRAREKCEHVLQGWMRVLDQDGLVVFHVDAEGRDGSCETRTLYDGAGVLCGRLFRRGHEMEPHTRGAPVDRDTTSQIVVSGCQALIESYWGRYVAIVRAADAARTYVLRDPTGTLPCFVTQLEHVHFVFSDLETCVRLRSFKFSINWRYVALFVPYPALQIRATGLNEVAEVQPGERLQFGAAGVERQLLWNPVDVAKRGLIEDPEAATRTVRETVRRCVHAWASVHRSIVHNLSGGLDSSIVLSCLADAPGRPAVAALHFFWPRSGEDERRFARLAANHLNVELLECALDPTSVELRKMLEIRCGPRPWFYTYDLEQSPRELEVAASREATALFSGAGGDGLFMQPRADLAVTDYLYRRGLGAHVMRVALDAARITKTSMWPILWHGVREHFKRPERPQYVGTDELRSLIRTDVSEAARNDASLVHPWLIDADDLPPGLRWHILCLSIPPAFYDCFDHGREVERTFALLSQPLMELCLRIPMYTWIAGGRDRSIARRAFASDLPSTIVRRTAKGTINRHGRMVVEANEAFLREVLLDGLLVQNGLLDRVRLAAFLSPRRSPQSLEYTEVLRQYLCTEVWLRRWSSATTSCAS